METLTMTYDQAARLKELLLLCVGPGPLLVKEGSMKIDDVSLEWKADTIRVLITDGFVPLLEEVRKDHE